MNDRATKSIDRILSESRTVAVVGLSDNPERPSHRVASYMKDRGFQVVPVNPAVAEVLGEKAYPSLSAVPFPVDLVDVFRKSSDVPPVAEEAVRIGARFFWMQEGVESPEAESTLNAAGIPYVSNRCVKKELALRGR